MAKHRWKRSKEHCRPSINLPLDLLQDFLFLYLGAREQSRVKSTCSAFHQLKFNLFELKLSAERHKLVCSLPAMPGVRRLQLLSSPDILQPTSWADLKVDAVRHLSIEESLISPPEYDSEDAQRSLHLETVHALFAGIIRHLLLLETVEMPCSSLGTSLECIERLEHLQQAHFSLSGTNDHFFPALAASPLANSRVRLHVSFTGNWNRVTLAKVPAVCFLSVSIPWPFYVPVYMCELNTNFPNLETCHVRGKLECPLGISKKLKHLVSSGTPFKSLLFSSPSLQSLECVMWSYDLPWLLTACPHVTCLRLELLYTVRSFAETCRTLLQFKELRTLGFFISDVHFGDREAFFALLNSDSNLNCIELASATSVTLRLGGVCRRTAGKWQKRTQGNRTLLTCQV
jgi:hypothetical protein